MNLKGSTQTALMWVDRPIPSLVISVMHPLQGDFWSDHVRDSYGSIQFVAIGPKMPQTVRKHRREREAGIQAVPLKHEGGEKLRLNRSLLAGSTRDVIGG